MRGCSSGSFTEVIIVECHSVVNSWVWPETALMPLCVFVSNGGGGKEV